mmetsp:Transcript_3709/g.10720  ORF Transcript_3709/g.10720 Transcript_3709/m.10720 type:complete len:466 (-) Transcript_3709:276-1673(-)
METVSFTDGWSTKTCWKRLSRAGSFSMYLRYSSRVVAPMQRSSPRPSIGLSRLPASIAPFVAPAPTTVWISSMKRMMRPLEFVTSLITALRRSSNSPRNLAPAMREPMSRAISVRSWRAEGTSPVTILCARPSATAVLPTPGSPISTGLFFVRRERIWIARRISSSRPITGSSFPSLAAFVRSLAYLLRASYLPSGSWSDTRPLPRISLMASSSFFASRFSWRSSDSPKRRSSFRARTRCSMDTYSSFHLALISWALVTTPSRFRPRTWPASPVTLGWRLMKASVTSSSLEGSLPAFWKMRRARPLGCSSMDLTRCSVSTICCMPCLASSGAPTMACHAFSVNSFWLILLPPPAAEAYTANCLVLAGAQVPLNPAVRAGPHGRRGASDRLKSLTEEREEWRTKAGERSRLRRGTGCAAWADRAAGLVIGTGRGTVERGRRLRAAAVTGRSRAVTVGRLVVDISLV